MEIGEVDERLGIRQRVEPNTPEPRSLGSFVGRPRQRRTYRALLTFRVIRPFLRALRSKTSFRRAARGWTRWSRTIDMRFRSRINAGRRGRIHRRPRSRAESRSKVTNKGRPGVRLRRSCRPSTAKTRSQAARRLIRWSTTPLDIRVETRGERVRRRCSKNAVPLSRAAWIADGGLYSVRARSGERPNAVERADPLRAPGAR